MLLCQSRLEVGGGECGKHTEETDTKMMKERDLKLPKALKDMLFKLRQNTNEKILRRVMVLGMLQYGMECYMCYSYACIPLIYCFIGLKMTLLLMDMPAGYICRVTRTGIVTVPSRQGYLPDFRSVLYMAWCAKVIVRRSLEVLATRGTQDDSDDFDDDFMHVMDPKDHDVDFKIPSTFTTPEK